MLTRRGLFSFLGVAPVAPFFGGAKAEEAGGSTEYLEATVDWFKVDWMVGGFLVGPGWLCHLRLGGNPRVIEKVLVPRMKVHLVVYRQEESWWVEEIRREDGSVLPIKVGHLPFVGRKVLRRWSREEGNGAREL